MRERYNELLRKTHANTKQVSTQTGIPYSTLNEWKNGKTKHISLDNLTKLAEYFNVPVGYFLGEEEIRTFEVAAGKGRINDAYGTLESDNKVDADEYARVRIIGDSMLPTLMPNDLVRVHLVTEGITPKDLAIVKINGDEATCKHVEFTESGLWLRAENKDVFADRFYTIQDVATIPVTVIGKVEAIIERKL